MLPTLKGEKAVMCLMEKICVINKLCSGLSYGAVGREFMLMNQQHRHPSFYCTSQIARLSQIKGLWQPCVQQVGQRHFSCSICILSVALCHILVTRGYRNLTLYFLQEQQFSIGQFSVHREFIKHNCHE